MNSARALMNMVKNAGITAYMELLRAGAHMAMPLNGCDKFSELVCPDPLFPPR